MLLEGGLPRPQTQIAIIGEFGDPIAYLDWGHLPLAGEGWEDLKIAVEYDGDHHRSDRCQYSYDIRRLEMLGGGWIVIRVITGDKPADMLRRVKAALARRA